MTPVKDLTSLSFGRLTVLRQGVTLKKPNRQYITWVCRCECGTEKTIIGDALKKGCTRSCGCLNLEVIRRGDSSRKHGLSRIPEYFVWKAMVRRCHGVNVALTTSRNYRDRGISVCPQWRGNDGLFVFLEDMGRRPSDQHTLERKNNNGNYEPNNCVWATAKVQGNNKRTNRLITCRNKTQTISAWSAESGVNAAVIGWRLSHGYESEEAIFSRRVKTKTPRRFENLECQIFGKLTVKSFEGTRLLTGKRKTARALWLCQCECGGTRLVTSMCLKAGHTKSCGCLPRSSPYRARRFATLDI